MPSASATRGRKKRGNSRAAARRGASPWLVGAVAAVVLFAGVIGYAVYQAQRSADQVNIPAGGSDTGITVGQPTARATVDLYIDYQCPVCKAYEEQVGPVLDQLVAAGQAKVVYHPVAYLDRFSGGTQYSTRSSQAAGCAADAGILPAYSTALFAAQPPENGSGLPDDQLVAIGRQAGAGDKFAQCVQDKQYAGWTASVTDAASRAGVNGTPTVKVNGADIQRTPDALTTAVQAAQG